MHKVSIVIPMYNEERYIARCLESLKKQTFQDFEVILVDDGSKDKTVEIASKYDVRILKQEHGGPGKARNWGAKEAKGDILVFVDADMSFDNRFLDELLKPVLNGKEVGTTHAVELVGNMENPIARAWCINRLPVPPVRSGVFRSVLKSHFEKMGGFDTSKGYCDDDLSKDGTTSLGVKEAIVYHNNPESFSEIYKHSMWVGASLIKTGHIWGYLKTYRIWIALFGAGFAAVCAYLGTQGKISYVPVGAAACVLVLVLAKAVQRTFREEFVSHLAYVPAVMLVRGAGYLSGAIKYLATSKIY